MKERNKRKEGILAFTLLLITILTLTSGTNAKPDYKKVLLSDVKTLVLTDGQFTTGRRSSPVPQLLCVGGSAGCPSDGKPKTVQCTQTGFDGYDATWECKADMDNQYKFGRISVICEGYEYPEDPYILAGSCGLEYELDSTSARNYNQGSYNYNYGSYYSSQSSSWYSILLFIFIAFIVYSVCFAAPYNGYQPYGGQGGYGGGYGGGPGGGGGGPGGPGCGPNQYYSSPPPSSGNNFWGGLATGGLLGYMLGGRRYGGYAPGYGYGGYGYGAPRYGGGGFGGGGFGGGGFGGGGTRMASGFGGTRRR